MSFQSPNQQYQNKYIRLNNDINNLTTPAHQTQTSMLKILKIPVNVSCIYSVQ